MLSNKERCCRAATLKCNFSGVLKISKQEVLLDEALLAFVPVCVARDLLQNYLTWFVRQAHILSHKIIFIYTLLALLLLFLLLGLRLTAKLAKEILRTLNCKVIQIISKGIFSDYWGLSLTAMLA